MHAGNESNRPINLTNQGRVLITIDMPSSHLLLRHLPRQPTTNLRGDETLYCVRKHLSVRQERILRSARIRCLRNNDDQARLRLTNVVI